MNWPFLLRLMWKNKPVSVCCRLMTWEYRSTFEEEPDLKSVRMQFLCEMPQWEAREGKAFDVRLWPMVSFNATEGRLWRYLVAFPPRNVANDGRRRYLPEQVSLVSQVNEFMMNLQEGNSGNCVFWTVYRDFLILLVYFEGRLCHWSEEPGYDSGSLHEISDRLDRFRKFLEQDSLFSRADHFEMIELKGSSDGFPQEQFLAASRDPFFRRLKLNGTIDVSGRRSWWLCHMKIPTTAFLILGALALFQNRMVEMISDYFENHSSVEIQDAVPVDLDLPPLMEFVEEPKNLSPRKVTSDCVPPVLNLKGIVGERLVIAEVDGQMKNLSLGDSLQSSSETKAKPYVVQKIARDRLTLKCLHKTLEVIAR